MFGLGGAGNAGSAGSGPVGPPSLPGPSRGGRKKPYPTSGHPSAEKGKANRKAEGIANTACNEKGGSSLFGFIDAWGGGGAEWAKWARVPPARVRELTVWCARWCAVAPAAGTNGKLSKYVASKFYGVFGNRKEGDKMAWIAKSEYEGLVLCLFARRR